MLKVKELHAGYGRIPILNGVNLDVAEGQVLGILGHNGMGKTTLIKTLMGFIDTTQGTIQLEGQDITRASPNRRARAGFGYVPQGRDIFPRMTVRDNLRFAVAASGRVAGVLLHPLYVDRGILLLQGFVHLVSVPPPNRSSPKPLHRRIQRFPAANTAGKHPPTQRSSPRASFDIPLPPPPNTTFSASFDITLSPSTDLTI